MGVRCAWRRRRGVDVVEMLGNHVVPNRATGRMPVNASQVHEYRVEIPGRAARRGCVVGNQSRSASASIWVSATLAAFSLLIFPAAFKQNRTLASVEDIREFADWKNAIPPTSTVLVAPARDVGAFVWFTLGRPNYLALDQSAGVVFSRATALEVATSFRDTGAAHGSELENIDQSESHVRPWRQERNNHTSADP